MGGQGGGGGGTPAGVLPDVDGLPRCDRPDLVLAPSGVLNKVLLNGFCVLNQVLLNGFRVFVFFSRAGG